MCGPNQIGINSFYGNSVNSHAPFHHLALKEEGEGKRKGGGGILESSKKAICLGRAMVSIRLVEPRATEKLQAAPETNTLHKPQTQISVIF